MRRTLDPEGYEDPGIKDSRLSLGEMSSEWLLRVLGDAGHAWAPSLHGEWRCTGTSVVRAPALQR